MAINSKLFSEFSPVTRKEWIDQATKDLKGADFEKKLVWKTDEGIQVQPFYTDEDREKYDPSVFGIDNTSRHWSNYISLDGDDEEKANQLAVRLKEFDIQGILFKLTKTEVDFQVLLKDLDPASLNLSFKLEAPSAKFISSYFNYLEANDVNLADIKGFVEADPLEEWITKGIEPDIAGLAEMIKVSSKAVNFKGLTICSHAFANAGANIVQELAFTLNKVSDHFDKLSQEGISPEDLAKELHFHLSIGGNYFFEIAKLRAFKVLAGEIISCFGVKSTDISTLSSSSQWSKSLFDSNVNMLRNTTEAMSAILGGTNDILINPHDSSFKESNEFSHRIALNISALLKEESYFDKVVDPAAGSYYIEEITKEIAEKSYTLFQEIEKQNGFIETFRSGKIQVLVSQTRAKKETDYATRKRVLVGTNKYPDQSEKEISDKSLRIPSEKDGLQLLVPQRMTKDFDQLRINTIKSGKVPKVALVCFGNLAMRKARASFSSEFFGTAGFHVLGESFFDNMEKAANEIAAGDADIVVLCSSDEEYATQGVDFSKMFRKLSSNKKLIVAGYPTEIIDQLQTSGVDSFIHVKTNVIEFISELQKGLS